MSQYFGKASNIFLLIYYNQGIIQHYFTSIYHIEEKAASLFRIFSLPISSQARVMLGPLFLPETMKRSKW